MAGGTDPLGGEQDDFHPAPVHPVGAGGGDEQQRNPGPGDGDRADGAADGGRDRVGPLHQERQLAAVSYHPGRVVQDERTRLEEAAGLQQRPLDLGQVRRCLPSLGQGHRTGQRQLPGEVDPLLRQLPTDGREDVPVGQYQRRWWLSSDSLLVDQLTL
jgi:hypothetical protein